MAKDFLEIKGVIEKVFKNAVFEVKLETGGIVQAHLSGKMRMHFIQLAKNDKVLLEISPYDLTKGRIIYRFK